MQTWKINRLGNGVVCVLLMVCLVFSSLFNVRKAEAIAPAIPAAGAALAALAAELGISETALIAGIAVTGVAATGLVAYGNAGTDTTLPPAPGFKPWDDLTPQEKQDWVGQDGNALDYQKQTIAWWALQYGLLEQTPNGDMQPTQEPDPDNDPDGNSRWHKLRNAMIALAIGGASIPMGEVVNTIADGLSDGVKGLLFGSGNNSLALSYSNVATLNNKDIYFATGSISGVSISQWYYFRDFNGTSDTFVSAFFMKQNDLPTVTVQLTNDGWEIYPNSSLKPTTRVALKVDGTISTNTASNGYSYAVNSEYAPLNALYGGIYNFDGGYSYNHGTWNNPVQERVDYGQLSDTPDGLSSSIINNNNYTNFINNYSDPGVDGYQRAITIPSGYGVNGYTPNYSDFVVVTPDGDVTPLPDDEQINPGGGNDNPDTPNTEYEQDFGQRVGELLAQPFDQLFPFCLIGDLRDFLEILADAGFGANDQNGMRALSDEQVNGIDVLRFDLTGFNVEGADYFEIELTPIHDFAVGFRGISTSVFIIMLLIGTFRFFINRGGE